MSAFDRTPSIGCTFPVGRESFEAIMAMEAHPHHEAGPADGRSEFLWIRTSDGDLILGSFPYGDSYFDIEHLVENDFDAARENGTLRVSPV